MGRCSHVRTDQLVEWSESRFKDSLRKYIFKSISSYKLRFKFERDDEVEEEEERVWGRGWGWKW